MTILREHCLLHVIWCDDIRQELGNKPSFMGVYTELVLPSVPVVLPRLAAFVTVYTPVNMRVANLSLRVMKSDDEKPLALVEMTDLPKIEDPKLATDDPATVRLISFGMLIGNVAITESTKWLKAFADCGDEHLESLKLRINHLEETPVQRARKIK
jgi:hypothetical protein